MNHVIPSDVCSDLKRDSIRIDHARIDKFEQELIKLPQVQCPVTHRFTPGIYSRQIFIPAGTVCTSKIHKFKHQFVVVKGVIEVVNVLNNEKQLIHAPYIGVTEPGTRRVVHVIEDTVWITFHATDETDIEKLEAVLIEERVDHLSLSNDMRRDLKAFQNCLNETPLEYFSKKRELETI